MKISVLEYTENYGLWIGFNEWPVHFDSSQQDLDFESLKGISLSCIQIGGFTCDHKQMYGFLFSLPDDDPLYVLAQSYISTNLPGRINELFATPLDEVI